jgi:hypothetical protein
MRFVNSPLFDLALVTQRLRSLCNSSSAEDAQPPIKPRFLNFHFRFVARILKLEYFRIPELETARSYEVVNKLCLPDLNPSGIFYEFHILQKFFDQLCAIDGIRRRQFWVILTFTLFSTITWVPTTRGRRTTRRILCAGLFKKLPQPIPNPVDIGDFPSGCSAVRVRICGRIICDVVVQVQTSIFSDRIPTNPSTLIGTVSPMNSQAKPARRVVVVSGILKV